MKRSVVTGLILRGLLMGCGQSDVEKAREHAVNACRDYGYDGDNEGTGSADSTTPDTSEDLAGYARDIGPVADEAALAARLDLRWDRLANALSDVQRLLKHASTSQDVTLPQEQRDAAQAQVEQLAPAALVRTVNQECRKATV
ncbi:hypothetical protein [Streptomyces canus]|uniref:hypothetical protein n=1 Tax=Streptomyces canus TaxID=58343 RepID=UPI003CE908A7